MLVLIFTLFYTPFVILDDPLKILDHFVNISLASLLDKMYLALAFRITEPSSDLPSHLTSLSNLL